MQNIIWQLTDEGKIKLDVHGVARFPHAKEIYEAEFNFKYGAKSRPSSFLRDITFKRIPLELKLKLTLTSREGIPFIQTELIAFNRIAKISTAILGLDTNYLICADSWYPILDDCIEDINEIFSTLGIQDLRNLTLKEFLQINRSFANEEIVEFSKEIGRAKGKINDKELPGLTNLKATLYPYQELGVRWLKKISDEDFGCIVADEMGLGKTIQIIALIAINSEFYQGQSIVICPATLMENWRREFQKFAPTIKTRIHAGPSRTGFPEILQIPDVVITSYETVVRDLSILGTIEWNFIICDEAQAIKNPYAKRTQSVKSLDGRVSIAMTGTPFENRLTDVWSILDFVAPNLLGTLEGFEMEFPNGKDSAERLEPIISPLMIRRRIRDVAKDLPDRIDRPQAITMHESMAEYYDRFRVELISKYGKKASIASLAVLRMFCCDPALALKDGINYDQCNNKLVRLMQICLKIIQQGEKGLVFTSYTGMIDKIIHIIKTELGCACNYIDGRVSIPERQDIVDWFTKLRGSAFLVLNPRAAGTGLNITAANHVIHYNLEWNPATEDQASARSHRRGQENTVFVHRLFYADTIEDYVNSKIEEKRQISNAAIIGTLGDLQTMDSIFESLQYSPSYTKT